MTQRHLQLWKCKKCGHTFYTPLTKKPNWFMNKFFSRKIKKWCTACSSHNTKKVKIITKEDK